MKCTIRNNLIAALVLGALIAPLCANAASSATVTITATVTEKFSVAVDKPNVSFNDGGGADVKITTTSNATKHGPGASLTITSGVEATGKTIKLKHATSGVQTVFPVDVRVGTQDANFGTNKQTTHAVAKNDNAETQDTILKFTSTSAAQSLPAGEYKGTLTITVSPA
ncbi:hypothetical protein [Pantoea sp. AMG 501]|uniref:hypothetical protein n=1 Tax=Pantoea sp. AMG 501 TaxID=2008894 RepID=UPI000B5A78BF|nr:hypothetical protein [Pantoea sp. AMG 501]OWY74463.1 hypothetical protein CDN97_23420 [Pantoea sp. AMG 501]